MLGVNTTLFSAFFALGLAAAVAQVVTTGCVLLLNYLGNRRITFAAPATAPAVAGRRGWSVRRA